MNIKRSKLVQVMAVTFVVIGLLIAAWPGVAQSTQPRRQPDQIRDSIGMVERASTTAIPHSQRLLSHQFPASSDPHSWTKIVTSWYVNQNWDIYTANGDGSAPHQLTNDPQIDTTPDLNHTATKVVFISNRDGNNEIYTANADGSEQRRLTYIPQNEYLPKWSPDGSKIVFYSYRDGNAEIYVMNADGSQQTRLTNYSGWDGHPTWSPDGQHIAFIRDSGSKDLLMIMDADGSNLYERFTPFLNLYYLNWSPNGGWIAASIDSNSDGWLEIWTIAIGTPGGAFYKVFGDPPTGTDFLAPVWSPDSQYIMFSKVQWTFYQGQYYWTSANTYSGQWMSSNYQPVSVSGVEWWPDWESADFSAPQSRVNNLTEWIGNADFNVTWSGTDVGPAGIMSYDIQYRDNANGAWTDWLAATNQTSAVFNGQYGHTYYFRSRARDNAFNTEAYPSSPNAMTTIYQYAASGQVFDNREQPVAVTSVQANPAALNTGVSRHDGAYDLHFASGGVYTLTTTRNNFGTLPPLLNVTVPNSNSLPTLYLPPLDNRINDSHFESGNLSAWNVSDDFTPTLTSTAHTGNYAVLLSGSVPTDTLTTGPWHSTIEQMINVSPTMVSGTLSLLYQVEAVEPLSDTLNAYLVGANHALTFTLPVTTTGWAHVWLDVSAWTEPTATVKIDLAVGNVGREAGIILDEITWGSAITGSHAVFLPLVRR